MKKVLSIILFIMSCIICVSSVGFYIYSINDIERTYYELANTPGVSGIDYWGIGWGYGGILFMASAIGAVFSGVSAKISQPKVQRYGSLILVAMFGVLMLLAICLFYS